MLLQIDERQMDPGITVLTLSGKLALGRESQRIESMVDDLTGKGTKRVIFDMAAVDYIDSAGIGLIALASGKVKQAGGKMALVAPEGTRVRQLLALTQVNAIVSVCDTLDQAAASFAQTQPPASA
ncbi:MAG TPA: STAS domain-containing protein [Bryobacteraceae bacterium]|jgi:anti-sigma B factor antagonist